MSRPLRLRARARILAPLIAALLVLGAAPVASSAQGDGADPGVTAPRARRPAKDRRRAAPAPPHFAASRGEGALSSDLHDLLVSRVRSGTWGAIVVSLSRGDTLFSFNPDATLQPASTMKLFTSALALDQFGPDHQFSTDVLRAGAVGSDGVLHGSLVLRGGGDPSLSPRFFPGSPGMAMDSLAGLVAAAGIKRVAGPLVADASAFDTERIPEGWQHRYLHAGYAARVSALSLNENLVWIVVRPTPKGAAVTLDPNTTIPLQSSVRLTRGGGARVSAFAGPDGTIHVRGWIGSAAGERRYQLVVEDPTAFTAGAFRRALEARGITIDGPTQYAMSPAGATVVASLLSPPLDRLLSAMNRESINHYAELLFRDAARHAAPARAGSVESGDTLLRQFLAAKVGAAPGSVVATDGSGLSVLDQVTPRAMVQLLAYEHRSPWRDAFHASLPVAGESELLRHRMKYTPAQGNLHAKTGTTNHVISLAGYVTADDGELLAFAFIYNGTDRWNAKSTIDAMGGTLAAFQR